MNFCASPVIAVGVAMPLSPVFAPKDHARKNHLSAQSANGAFLYQPGPQAQVQAPFRQPSGVAVVCPGQRPLLEPQTPVRRCQPPSATTDTQFNAQTKQKQYLNSLK